MRKGHVDVGARFRALVSNTFHVRLIAMIRLGLLPVEVERGRWNKVPRDQRVCEACGAELGSIDHFLTRCKALPAGCADPDYGQLWTHLSTAHNPKRDGCDGRMWRTVARVVEVRWRAKSEVMAKRRRARLLARHVVQNVVVTACSEWIMRD